MGKENMQWFKETHPTAYHKAVIMGRWDIETLKRWGVDPSDIGKAEAENLRTDHFRKPVRSAR